MFILYRTCYNKLLSEYILDSYTITETVLYTNKFLEAKTSYNDPFPH